MRRHDREITDNNKIQEIINNSHCCRLGLNDDGKVYIVPLNFGYTYENGVYEFYFHSAKAGRKVDIMRKNNQVCFEFDTNYKLLTSDKASECTAAFQSIIGNGFVTFFDTAEEKILGLSKLMKHNTGKEHWEYDKSCLNAVLVFKVTVTEISCKEHL